MAELTTGAVATLLGVIRNEAQRLGRVRGDVQFIQEEMESMNSFLAHLARTRGEEHDEQVRTWMNQVRILANDCNNCLDVYLYRGNLDFHRPRRGLRRYLWWGWAVWWLREMIAQRHAAAQLRELKDRARDVGERRMRYGVKLKVSAGQSPFPEAGLGAAQQPSSIAEDDDDNDDEEGGGGEGRDGLGTNMMATPDDTSTVLNDYFHKRITDWIDYCLKNRVPKKKLVDLEKEVAWDEENWREVWNDSEPSQAIIPSITFVLPDKMDVRASDFVSYALSVAKTNFRQSVLVDVRKVHLDNVPLRPKEILYYILHEMASNDADPYRLKLERGIHIYYKKKEFLLGIRRKIQAIDEMFRKMKDKVITRVDGEKLLQSLKVMKVEHDLKDKIAQQGLDALLWLLICLDADVAEEDISRKKPIRKLLKFYDDIIQTAAQKLLEECIQAVQTSATGSQKQVPQVSFNSAEYQCILKEVFPRTPTGAGTSTSKSVEAEIKEMIYMVKDMIDELQEHNKSDKNRDTSGLDQSGESTFQEAAIDKIDKIKSKIREQMKIKWIFANIVKNLKDESSSKNESADERILIVLRTDPKYVSIWRETISTLNLLETSRYFAGAAIVTTTTTKNTGGTAAEYFSDPALDLVQYSLVGIYFDIVIQHIREHMDEDKQSIVRAILEECGQHEFCMKIFTQALVAKPKRSTEELRKLHNILQATPKLQPSIARKVLKFSYSDLPKQHKSCLLYLAIFPPDAVEVEAIRRSTLIGRWVAEGLITTEDWCWSSSVAEAEKCFQSFIQRKIICPVDIGATGKVKSCTVDPLVHGFITMLAKKQHIVEARLSIRWARHFSIFNDVRLRFSDTIETLLTKNINELSQFSKLKVLDLEGCNNCVFANKGYIKDICNKIQMLKYLSLNGTDVNQLPREINNLHELEVLDIRRTKIPASATRPVLLRKLKRLLAGHIIIDAYASPYGTDSRRTEDFSSVEIPEFIEKMLDVEVLSNVKPRKGRDLGDIGKLSNLQKLSIVINKESHIRGLLNGIDDLRSSLRSLSITLQIHTQEASPLCFQKKRKGTHSGLESLISISGGGAETTKSISGGGAARTRQLESLSISGGGAETTKQLFQSLLKQSDKLAKVTLSGTSLRQENLEALAKLGNLGCIRFRHGAYIDRELTFGKDEFPKLKILMVDSSEITRISFTGGSPKLEKIIWSSTNKMESPWLSGVDNLLLSKEHKLVTLLVPDEG